MYLAINGEFITKVSSFGDGPTEYSSLSTFFIDEEKRILILSDFNKAYLRYYDLDTYQYISCDKFDFYTDCAPLGIIGGLGICLGVCDS